MDRAVANFIRRLMDSVLPTGIRDSKFFMYPFFYYAYRGKRIDEVMDFKRNIYRWDAQEYAEFYKDLDSISRNRPTDLNQGCIEAILRDIPLGSKNLVDVGCGHGYLLRKIHQMRPEINLVGLDLKPSATQNDFKFVTGEICNLPFDYKSFDVVTCCHTLEHILDLKTAVDELKRVAKKSILVVVPCQRYFYYTLDEHINFFPFEEVLTAAIGISGSHCERISGDLYLRATL